MTLSTETGQKPYFHLITDEQWKKLKASGMTWAECAEKYAPPSWCSYPHAVDPMGCWSLVGRMVTGEKYCKSCDLHSGNVRREELLRKLGWFRLLRFVNRFRKQRQWQ